MSYDYLTIFTMSLLVDNPYLHKHTTQFAI